MDSCEEETKNKKTYHLAYHLNEHYNCLLTLEDMDKMSELRVSSDSEGWASSYGWIATGIVLALILYIGFKYFMV